MSQKLKQAVEASRLAHQQVDSTLYGALLSNTTVDNQQLMEMDQMQVLQLWEKQGNRENGMHLKLNPNFDIEYKLSDSVSIAKTDKGTVLRRVII